MLIAVIGSRKGVSAEFVRECLDGLVCEGWFSREAGVVSGGATGVDTFARLWSEAEGREFVEVLPKSWDRLCLLKRDREIVDLADKLVAFKYTGSKTHGTDFTFSLALKKGIPTKIFYYPLAQGVK